MWLMGLSNCSTILTASAFCSSVNNRRCFGLMDTFPFFYDSKIVSTFSNHGQKITFKVKTMHSQFHDFITQLLPDHGIDLAKISLQIKKHNVQKDDYLFREGEICQFTGFIVKGCFRIFLLKDDKEITFDFFVENRPIADYESYFRKRPTPFYFQAIEPSEVLILTPSCLEQLFEEPPNGQRLQRIFVETLFFRLRDKLLSLYVDEPEARYLTLLQTEPELVQRVPQYYLASYLGIEPESLSRLKRRILSRSASNLRIN
jgi:CRP/FNR family transcriptional regulator, anaerobic regulatory protein